MEKKFKKELSSLVDIFSFIKDFTDNNSIEEGFAFSINFVIEELFTNMVKYSSKTKNDILISTKIENNEILIKLIDYDVESFDIRKAKNVDTTQSLKEREIGGLGIHLVKKIVDHLNYKYEDGNSIITIVKNMEN